MTNLCGPARKATATERVSRRISHDDREQDAKSIYQNREQRYRLNSDQAKVFQDVGVFRAITANSLCEHLYDNNNDRFRKDLRNLAEQRLLSIQSGSRENGGYVSLTRAGKELTEASLRSNRSQTIYSGIVKKRELRHDAAIYDVYQKEAEKIAKAGGSNRYYPKMSIMIQSCISSETSNVLTVCRPIWHKKLLYK